MLTKEYLRIQEQISDTISKYYITRLPDGRLSQVLYYFWVMQAICPNCEHEVDLFSKYIFAKHANPRINPIVRVVCPGCGDISSHDHWIDQASCSICSKSFDPRKGSANGRTASCSECDAQFNISHAIGKYGLPPSYRMYAKLVLTPEGNKEYHPIIKYDEELYQQAINELNTLEYKGPQEIIEPGYNTNQVINYGFHSWHQMFNARQLLCHSQIVSCTENIDDPQTKNAFVCLFSSTLEFNNMFASYKGEGTGAVRHMFYHHILKPERMPIEANIWGTRKSSGTFSTLFSSRLLRAAKYLSEPFELSLDLQNPNRQTKKFPAFLSH